MASHVDSHLISSLMTDNEYIHVSHMGPKIEKQISVSGDGGGLIGSVSRSEEDLFSDAVTEFADSGTSAGSANKTLDRDLFFSFNDAENGGTNDVINTPVEGSKLDAGPEVSAKQDIHVEKSGATEVTVSASSELTDKDAQCLDGLVKHGVLEPTPESSYVSQSQEAKSIEVVEAGERKSQGSQTFETTAEEAKNSEISKTTPEVSEIVGGYDDIIKQENFEKLEPATADEISEEIRPEIESVCEHVSELSKEPEIVESPEGINEEIEHEKTESDNVVVTPEIVNESEIVKGEEEVGDAVKHEKCEPDHKHVLEASKGSEIDEAVTVLTEKDDVGASKKQTEQAVKEPNVGLTEKQDFGAVELEKCSKEEIQVVNESDSVLTAKEDLGEPILEEGSSEHTHKDAEVSGSVLIVKENLGEPELEKCSKEQIQEVVKEPNTVLTEKDDLGEPKLEKNLNESIQEVFEKSDSVLAQKQDLGAPSLEKSSKEIQPDLVLAEKEDLDASKSEKSLNENTHEVIEHKVDQVSNDIADVCVETPKDPSDNSFDGVKNASGVAPKPLVEEANDKLMNDQESGERKVKHVSNDVADVCVETITPIDSSDNITDSVENASGVVPKPLVEEGNDKLMNNQESGVALSVDSSSRNSLEGNWGSVSVLSTASINAETLHGGDQSKLNPEKSTAATSDVFEPPSFMTLVEPEGKDQRSVSSEVQDSKQQPNSEASQEGWFPTLPKVNNESEGRKKNEEAIAKVTNWSSGKQSTPLKNLLGEAKSPSAKQPESVIPKDEATNEKAGETPLVNQDMSSPPKLIEDGKKAGKKVKGRSSWIPFVCCSSVNVVK
uniref:enolase-phosphatase E1-like n=1 Tax=Erigeron canadensis TaxID=72917 RepID=UPI001CB9D7FA|nr:enolase-phosphatase E1-like [Erigeron canadensis]